MLKLRCALSAYDRHSLIFECFGNVNVSGINGVCYDILHIQCTPDKTIILATPTFSYEFGTYVHGGSVHPTAEATRWSTPVH